MPTRRQQIVGLLGEGPITVFGIAERLGVKIAEVVSDLAHVERSLRGRLRVGTARCKDCGFTMKREGRFTAPSRCPKCKSERTTEPELELSPEGES